MYLRQYKPKQQWQAVAIFAKRSYDPGILAQYQELFESDRIVRLYLDELAQQEAISTGVGIVQLVVAKPKDAKNLVNKLMATTNSVEETLKLIETVLVYKFPKLSSQKIEKMFTISDLKQTRVYQDAKQEGELEKAQSLVLRQLTRSLGMIDSSLTQDVQKLETSQFDDLAEALLDFSALEDLKEWLGRNR